MNNIKLLPRQWEVFHPTQGVDVDIRLYQGGVGSGKTFLGSLVGLSVLAKNPGATWLVAADTYSRLRITTCETYEALLDEANIRYSHNKTDHIIKIPAWDNARVLFKGLDDAKALRSVNGIGGHLEEASLLPENAFLEFVGRLRQGNADEVIRLVLTTNPDIRKGWLYDYFVARAGVHEEEVRGKTIKVNRSRVVAATMDNPHVSNAFIASLKNIYDEELWNIMVMGEDGDYTSGLVVKGWSEINIQPTEYIEHLTLYLSCDFNVDPMCWVVAHRYNGEYHFIDELCIENTTTFDTAEEFFRRYGKHKAGLIITGDASGENRSTQAASALDTNYTIIRNRLSALGMTNVSADVRRANPAVASRVAAFNAMVHNNAGVRRVKANPRCKWLIWNMGNLRYIPGTSIIYEPTPREIEQDKNLKFTKHPYDAASYLVEHYDPIRLEVPRSKSKFITIPFSPHRGR